VVSERKRRICWRPEFDEDVTGKGDEFVGWKVCLQGGCSYCSDAEPRWRGQIWRKAQELGYEEDYRIGCQTGGPGRPGLANGW
jgi:hypothetical protein